MAQRARRGPEGTRHPGRPQLAVLVRAAPGGGRRARIRRRVPPRPQPHRLAAARGRPVRRGQATEPALTTTPPAALDEQRPNDALVTLIVADTSRSRPTGAGRPVPGPAAAQRVGRPGTQAMELLVVGDRAWPGVRRVPGRTGPDIDPEPGRRRTGPPGPAFAQCRVHAGPAEDVRGQRPAFGRPGVERHGRLRRGIGYVVSPRRGP